MTLKENERLAVVETKVQALSDTAAAMDVKLDQVVEYIIAEKAARQSIFGAFGMGKTVLLVIVAAGGFFIQVARVMGIA